MKISLDWLNQLAKTSLSAEQAAERLTMTSSEVDGWEVHIPEDPRIVTARIHAIRPHPNADRLRLVTVSYGAREKLEVVCGASNIDIGAYVILALEGAQIHGKNGAEVLRASEVRGVLSKGMLCGLEELGLPAQLEGIHHFPDAVALGKPAAHYLGSDTVLEVGITANRPDLLGHVGLARELAAATRKPWREPVVPPVPKTQQGTTPVLKVEAPGTSSLYTAHLSVSPTSATPQWIHSRLVACGLRSVHPVVDVLNYVMLEYGQPLHAYDATAFGTELHIRQLATPTLFTALNKEQYELLPGDLVTTNAKGELGDVVGIVGSAQHAVQTGTSEILLKVGTFPAAQLRRTGRRLGVRTDALARFEKFLPTGMAHVAFRRALELLTEVCEARLLAPTAHYTGQEVEPDLVSLTFHQTEQLLGVSPSPSETRTILERLGFAIIRMTKSGVTVRPPFWRRDITLPEDLIEELARIWGYERIPAELPVGPLAPPMKGSSYDRWHIHRRALARCGMRECIFHPFVSQTELELFGMSAVPLLQPLSSELAYLAPSNLIRLVLDTAKAEPQVASSAWFCSGAVFPDSGEVRTLALLVRDSNPERAVRTLNQGIAALLSNYGGGFEIRAANEQPHYLEKGEVVSYYVDDVCVGTGGRAVSPLTPKVRNAPETLIAEISLDALDSFKLHMERVMPVAESPTHVRDVTYAWDVPAGELMSQLNAVPQPENATRSIELVSAYKEGKPATLTFRISFTPHATPITEADLTRWMHQFPNPLT